VRTMLALTLYATVLSRRVVTPTTRDASISTSFSTPIVHWNSTTCLRPDLVVASKGLLHPAQHLSLPRHGRRLLRKLRTRITASCLAHIDLFRDAGAAASRRARAAWHTFCSSWARRAFVLARLSWYQPRSPGVVSRAEACSVSLRASHTRGLFEGSESRLPPGQTAARLS